MQFPLAPAGFDPVHHEAVGTLLLLHLSEHRLDRLAAHFDVRITDDALSWRRNNAGIAAEARLDGLYVIRTTKD